MGRRRKRLMGASDGADPTEGAARGPGRELHWEATEELPKILFPLARNNCLNGV